MTRYRHTSPPACGDTVVTHCTIDAGPGEPQTAITFRSGPYGADVLVVFRPEPASSRALNDTSDHVKLG